MEILVNIVQMTIMACLTAVVTILLIATVVFFIDMFRTLFYDKSWFIRDDGNKSSPEDDYSLTSYSEVKVVSHDRNSPSDKVG